MADTTTDPVFTAEGTAKADVAAPLQKIIYPSNLINNNSRYGNQFMALYINTDNNTRSSKSISKTTSPIIKDKDGNQVDTTKLPSHLGSIVNNFNGIGSIVNNFNVTGILDTASRGGNLRATNQGSITPYAIYLPVPMNLSSAFNIEYSPFEFGTEAAKLLETSIRSITGVAAEVASSLFGQAALATIPAALSKLSLSAFGAANQVAINPHRQLLFKGVGLRKFDFTYKLVARNVTETQTIDYIIRLLRYYMHPELNGALLYTYPSEFDLEFWSIDSNGNPVRNTFLPFISTSVLQDLTVNYSGNKEFSSHPDGSPVEYELTLKFQETQVLNKNVIDYFDSYIRNENIAVESTNSTVNSTITEAVNSGAKAVSSFLVNRQ